MTVIVTDAKYRSSLSVIRALAKCGHDIVLTQTMGDSSPSIPSFSSRYVTRTVRLDCSADDADAYLLALTSLIREYNHPVVFPIGAKTLSLIAAHRDELAEICSFTVCDKDTLELANDKLRVALAARELGIKTPPTYTSADGAEFPVIIKPVCGEKFGLTAKDRYTVVNSREDFDAAYEKMSRYGGEPIIQKKIVGTGIGVSLLMDQSGKAVSAICHRRVREYPISGGPSACCESFYDEGLVKMSERLLKKLNFTGMAMVEYKLDGDVISSDNAYLLEINPRVWGSFPLTFVADTSFASDYVELSSGNSVSHPLDNYKIGVRMNFILSDLSATLSLIKRGRFKESVKGIFDIILHRAVDGMKDKTDKAPFRKYLKLKLFKK